MLGSVYWDSCCFTALLNPIREAKHPEKADRHTNVLHHWKEAKAGKLHIYTSVMTIGEVLYCDDYPDGSEEAQEYIESVIRRTPWVRPVSLDGDIMVEVMKLRMKHPKLSGIDATHMVTAIRRGVKVLHTYDGCGKSLTEKHMLFYHARFPVMPGGMLSITVPQIPDEDTGIIALSKGDKGA